MAKGRRKDADGGDVQEDVRAASTRAAIEAQSKRSIRETWWPAVDTEEAARKTARYGFWAAVVSVLLACFLIGVQLFVDTQKAPGAERGLVWWAVADAVVFAAISVGLYFYSRVAAVAALVLFVASKVYGWALLSEVPQVGALLIAALFIIFYIHGVRGTFALARHLRGGG